MNIPQLRNALQELLRLPAQISSPFAAYITRQLKAQYSTKTDPYGNAWAPYKDSSIRRGRSNLLIESNAMRAGTLAKALQGAGVALEVGHPDIAKFHEGGTRFMASRKVLPEYGLPSKWRAQLERLVNAQLRKRF